jgi:adenylosuccinate lyase
MAAIWSDQGKYDRWLQVEIAVCDAWAERGDIPREAAEKIRHARYNLEEMERYLKEIHHDVISFLRTVTDSLGEEGRYVHMGLTSYDVVDTALGMQLRDAADLIDRDLVALTAVVEERAREHKYTLMMGRTHGVHAEPITFGLKLASWVDELRRNQRRLGDAREEVAVGKISGPVGSHATVPPEIEEAVCARLGLGVEPVSTQIVHRDRHARFLTTLAILASSLDRFATEIRHLQRTEVLEVEEPFEKGQAGSSAMPHKRNPEKCERVCGLARVVRGYALTGLENVALWHERDLTDSAPERIILPDACLLVDYMLDLFTYVMKGLQVYPERMRENLELTQGLGFSQRLLLALIDKGLSREKAYAIVQANSMRAWKERCALRGLVEADPEVNSLLSAADLDAIFDYGIYTKYVDHSFKRVNLS